MGPRSIAFPHSGCWRRDHWRIGLVCTMPGLSASPTGLDLLGTRPDTKTTIYPCLTILPIRQELPSNTGTFSALLEWNACPGGRTDRDTSSPQYSRPPRNSISRIAEDDLASYPGVGTERGNFIDARRSDGQANPRSHFCTIFATAAMQNTTRPKIRCSTASTVRDLPWLGALPRTPGFLRHGSHQSERTCG